MLKICALLSKSERRHACMLGGMVLVMAFLDILGVSSILPFMAVVAKPDLIQVNTVLNFLFINSQFIGIHTTEQFLFALGVFVFYCWFFFCL